jgi:glycosyltransferase involved in cell wall biosynthesis
MPLGAAYMPNISTQGVIRLLAIVEALTVTGPAKNLIEFWRVLQNLDSNPQIELSIATFERLQTTLPHNLYQPAQFVEVARQAGIPVHVVQERVLFDPKVVSSLRRVISELSPDVIQTHGVKSHFLMRLSGVWRSRPWIAFHHGYTREGLRMRVYDELDRWSLRVPSHIVTVCQSFKAQLASRGASRDRITVLHNAIGPDWFVEHGTWRTGALRPNGPLRPKRENEHVILTVGRLTGEKAHGDLVIAIHHLHAMRPDVIFRLIVLGEGPDRKRIERLASLLNLQDRVTLIGHVPDVRPYYQASDALAISSISEGSPNVLLEAMAAGIPIVATAVGGIPEIASHGQTALLVPPRDPVAMAQALEVVLSTPDLAKKLVSNARILVRHRFSPRTRAQLLVDLYGEVCQTFVRA